MVSCHSDRHTQLKSRSFAVAEPTIPFFWDMNPELKAPLCSPKTSGCHCPLMQHVTNWHPHALWFIVTEQGSRNANIMVLTFLCKMEFCHSYHYHCQKKLSYTICNKSSTCRYNNVTKARYIQNYKTRGSLEAAVCFSTALTKTSLPWHSSHIPYIFIHKHLLQPESFPSHCTVKTLQVLNTQHQNTTKTVNSRTTCFVNKICPF